MWIDLDTSWIAVTLPTRAPREVSKNMGESSGNHGEIIGKSFKNVENNIRIHPQALIRNFKPIISNEYRTNAQ